MGTRQQHGKRCCFRAQQHKRCQGLNNIKGVKATGSVYGGASVENLTRVIKTNESLHNIDAVVLLAGTNNIANKEPVSKITSKLDSLLCETKTAYPSASVIMSGLHHRSDLPLKSTNEAINKLNSSLRALCQERGAQFVDNNSGSSAMQPIIDRLDRRGLHLNKRGRRQLAQRLLSAIQWPDLPANNSTPDQRHSTPQLPHRQQLQHKPVSQTVHQQPKHPNKPKQKHVTRQHKYQNTSPKQRNASASKANRHHGAKTYRDAAYPQHPSAPLRDKSHTQTFIPRLMDIPMPPVNTRQHPVHKMSPVCVSRPQMYCPMNCWQNK